MKSLRGRFLGAPVATRSKDATRNKGHRYERSKNPTNGAPGIALKQGFGLSFALQSPCHNHRSVDPRAAAALRAPSTGQGLL